MNTTSTRGTIRKLLAGGALAAALVAPLGLATPAQAATSGGCTVTPLTPIFDGFNSAGVKLVRFRVKISCDAGRTVTVQQQRWEDDQHPDRDDSLGTVSFTRTFDGSRSTITVASRRTLPNTERGNEEIYQRVRFRVSSNQVTSPWSAYENSRQASMPN